MAEESEREAIAAVFDDHADEEAKILDQYRALSEHLEDGPMAFIIGHILTEEELHHFLLINLAKWLRYPLAGEASAGPEGELRQDLIWRTRKLQEHERETVEACRRLKSQLSGEEGDLLGTLLDAMALDSKKHELLLAAVARMMGA